jgi:two-component system, chemotaxis family, sensor kinase CheA
VTDPEQDFLKKLREAFAFEAKEQLQIISSHLLKLEKQQDETVRKELVEVMFRQAHNLKGSARAVNMSGIESLCQSLEAALSEMKKGRVPLRENYLDSLLACADLLEQLLAEEDKTTPQLEAQIATVKDALSSFFISPDSEPATRSTADSAVESTEFASIAESYQATGAINALTATGGTERSGTMDSTRLSSAKLDELLLQAEEMLSIKRAAIQHAGDVASMTDEAELWKKEWQNFESSLRTLRGLASRELTDIESLHLGVHINKLLGFLEWNHNKVNGWTTRLTHQRKLVYEDTHAICVSVDSFLESTKKLLLMPCSALFEGFPRLVREMSRDLGKDVELEVLGSDVELDRRILARMRDPLVHLIRNSIDHGIEPPEVRRQSGKASCAKLTLAVHQDESGKVEINIGDDGAGIDIKKVTSAALKAGMVNQAEVDSMTDEDKIALIFQSAISTSPIITEISGYGLGLAIVKENVTNIGGSINVDTRSGSGTSFRILLPAGIATFQGVLLDAGGSIVTVPKANLLRVLRLESDQIKSIDSRDAFEFKGMLRPLLRLFDLLELESLTRQSVQSPFLLVAVVKAGEDVIGLIVDDILEEQEVMVKKLGKPLNRVRNVAGVTILRTGEAVPVLNVADLVKSAKRSVGKSAGQAAQYLSPKQRKRVLVVDDTLTSRMLVKNIMEAAGYDVKTAADGVEALEELNSAPFDLVLADVEMPRMDGLELTKRVRAISTIADLPVVLLTSLASREHREKGVQAGANAYFTKGSFDQTSLLDVIKRLI